jgi:protein-export membrane protein SecD
MSIIKLLKEPRILILVIFLIFSFIAIGPIPVRNPDTGLMTLETNIQKGMDLEGGVRAIILPEENTAENVDKSILVLQTRINTFGLKETRILPVTIENERYIQLELAGSDEKQMKQLIEHQGKFEAKIPRTVEIKDNEGIFKLDGKDYPVSVSNEDIIINNEKIRINDSFELDEIELEYFNKTGNLVLLNAVVYKGDDILKIFRDVEHSNVRQVSGDVWQFRFTILVSKESARKFAKVTKDVGVEFAPGGSRESYLKTNINLFMDDNLVDSLRIGSGLKGQILTQPLIEGPGENKEDALNKMKSLQSILESGALPTKINIVKIDSVSPTLGQQFMRTAIIAMLIAIFVVSIIIFVRYKDLKIVVPIILTSSSEIFIIFGVAAAINWTIDLAAIAGIIAAVGTGVDDQIVITDETSRRKELSLKAKLKHAFFIIMAAWATTVAAMFPLLSIGAGAVRGFALTTIIGVTIGVLITRPAYAKVIEYLKK